MSVVVPCYNEAERLPDSFRTLLCEQALPVDVCEVIFVDDGSRDDTLRLLRQVDDPIVRVISHPQNRGKGAAVRSGIDSACGEFVMFMDADLATDLDCIPDLLHALTTADVAIGSRSVAGATVERARRSRALMGRTFNLIVRRITGLQLDDTQCGFKAFRRQAAEVIFDRSTVDGFGFDVELLVIARAHGLSVAEVPVRWTAVPGSRIRPVRDSLRMITEVIRVRTRHRWSRSRDLRLAFAR